MNYMWEALLKGDEKGLPKGAIRFKPSKISNPYREVFFENFNVEDITVGPIEVNAYYRYGSVFGALLSEDMDSYPDIRQVLFDILAHYLSELDLRSGLCRDEHYAHFLREDIMAGIFGQKSAECLNCFGKKEKRIVAAGLLRLYRVGTSTKLFSQLLRELYPNSIVYLDVRDIRELLIYVGKKQTVELSGQLQLLCDLFVPADYDVHLFWDRHFGLIGVDETMEIGSFVMY